MNINLNHIPQDGIVLTEDLDPYALDLQIEELTFTSPIHVKVEVRKILDAVSIKAQVKAETALVCGRCLEEYPSKYEEEIDFNYSVTPADRYLELDDDLRQEVILSYPIKLLCKEDCKGICPGCGKNLNKETCNCNK